MIIVNQQSAWIWPPRRPTSKRFFLMPRELVFSCQDQI
jgi:hypothetical protein